MNEYSIYYSIWNFGIELIFLIIEITGGFEIELY